MTDLSSRLAEIRRRLAVASLMLEAGQYAEVISRSFYAMHAAAGTLLRARDVTPRTYAALKAMLGRLYVREELLAPVHLRAIDQAFKDRMQAEYDDRPFSRAEARQRLHQAHRFVDAAADLLR